jgi:hypothetical protein
MKDGPDASFPPCSNKSGKMGGARRDAGFCFDKIDNVEPEAPREIGPRIMVGYELYPCERSRYCDPPLHVFFQRPDKALTVLNNPVTLLGKKADQSFGDSCGYDDGILRIEPVMRVCHAMRMTTIALDIPSLNLKKGDANGRIDVSFASAHQARVPGLREQSVEPVIVTKANTHYETGSTDLLRIFWLGLESFWIGRGRDDRFNLHEGAAYSGDELSEVAR